MTDELAVIDVQAELVVRRPPQVVLEEAHKAARALKDIIEAKPKKVMFNGEQYLEFEDWQTVARFYGITAKVTKTGYVKYGDVYGFSAHAVALRADGFELSAAEAECLTDEEKWRSRTKYEWQDVNGQRQRVKVGEESVPLFQLKSMAQTRACAKAFRNVLAWVVVLAGYRATPAEELGDLVDRVGLSSGSSPSPIKTTPATQPQPPAGQPSAAADGVTTVADVKYKSGTKNGKPWKYADVKFADGRTGRTFDTGLHARAEELKQSGAACNPDLNKSDKGCDLNGFLPIVKAEPVHEDEPISGPEKILTVRKVDTDAGPRWIINTDKRVVVTDQEAHALLATEARAAGQGLQPTVEVVRRDGHPPVNKLVSWAAAPAPARDPGQEG